MKLTGMIMKMLSGESQSRNKHPSLWIHQKRPELVTRTPGFIYIYLNTEWLFFLILKYNSYCYVSGQAVAPWRMWRLLQLMQQHRSRKRWNPSGRRIPFRSEKLSETTLLFTSSIKISFDLNSESCPSRALPPFLTKLLTAAVKIKLHESKAVWPFPHFDCSLRSKKLDSSGTGKVWYHQDRLQKPNPLLEGGSRKVY